MAVSNQTPSSALRGEMEKLEFLVGEWKGKGWSYRLDGSPSGELSQSTKVKRGKDGSTLSINDKKKHPDLRIATGVFPGMISNYPIEMSYSSSVYFDEGTRLYYWLRKHLRVVKSSQQSLLTPGLSS